MINVLDIALPILYLCIGAWCFVLARKGLKSRSLIFRKGTKGTRLEHSAALVWAQIIGTFVLGGGMLVYAVIYAFSVLRKFPLAG